MRLPWILTVAAGLVAVAAMSYAAGKQAAPGTGQAGEEEFVSNVVRAQKFEVVDEGGKVRAQFDAAVGPRLVLLGKNDRPRIALSLVTGSLPALTLYDDAGTRRAHLWIVDGDPGLALSSDQGTGSATLEVLDSGPRLVLREHSTNAVIWRAP